MESEAFVLLLGALVGALVGRMIGARRGRERAGTWWGLLLGPLGWLIVAAGPDLRPKCPACRGPVEPDATRCRGCGEDLGEVDPARPWLRPST